MLKDIEYQFYKTLSRVEQDSLLKWTSSFLKESYSIDRVVETKDYVYAIGDVPIILVAHLDTVHTSIPREIYYDRDEQVIWSPQGIGADDRAGVYAIIRMVMKGLRPHILFTTDEEKGGIGAAIAAKELSPELNFAIQLDRRGANDSVFYECDNPEFEKHINEYGFITNYGTFSDISSLCPEWGIAGVNLSIGYVSEHTSYERLHVDHMLDTIEKVTKIIEEHDSEKDKYKYIPSFDYNYGVGYTYDYGKNLDFGYGYKREKYALKNEICYECFNGVSPNLIIDMGKDGKYCGDCYSKLFTTCIECKTQFKDPYKIHVLCDNCRKEV